jgi:cyclic pyranopterin monophosphate synthase
MVAMGTVKHIRLPNRIESGIFMAQLSHLDEQGRARMVDVSAKEITSRIAIASGSIHMRAETLALILEDKIEKGDVFSVARVAGIMAAKKTSELIPMCHPLNITAVEIELTAQKEPARVDIEATVRVSGKTGVEMEAMTAVSVAGLTIYDMCKAVDREMTIGEIRLVKKSGGKSGTFIRKE